MHTNIQLHDYTRQSIFVERHQFASLTSQNALDLNTIIIQIFFIYKNACFRTYFSSIKILRKFRNFTKKVWTKFNNKKTKLNVSKCVRWCNVNGNILLEYLLVDLLGVITNCAGKCKQKSTQSQQR